MITEDNLYLLLNIYERCQEIGDFGDLPSNILYNFCGKYMKCKK